jgi:dUTP pyrophosphatase
MLKVYKIDEEAIIPKYATTGSACFDLHACLLPHTTVKARSWSNEEDIIHVNEYGIIALHPMSRVLVPTGLIFDIPKNHSLRLHPRSGLSFISGVNLANCEGVIDQDYTEPVYVALYNSSNQAFKIAHGDRICQAELVCDARYPIIETDVRPKKKTNRSGGFGSTGT